MIVLGDILFSKSLLFLQLLIILTTLFLGWPKHFQFSKDCSKLKMILFQSQNQAMKRLPQPAQNRALQAQNVSNVKCLMNSYRFLLYQKKHYTHLYVCMRGRLERLYVQRGDSRQRIKANFSFVLCAKV